MKNLIRLGYYPEYGHEICSEAIFVKNNMKGKPKIFIFKI